MKKIFAIVAMAVACLSANAQQQAAGTFSIMPKVGLGYGNLTNALEYTSELQKKDFKFDNYVNIEAGAEAKYQINDVFGVSAGLEYQLTKSTSSDDTKIILLDGSSVQSSKTYFDFGFLNVPILAHFNLGNHFGAEVGVQPGFLLSSKCGDVSIKDNCSSFQFGIPVGISWTFNSPLVLDLRYVFPCTKLNNNRYLNETGKDSKLNTITLTLGYRIDM